MKVIIIICFFAIAILGKFSWTNAVLCGEKQNYYPDVYLSASYVKEFTNMGRKQCIRACHSNLYCWSYSYNKITFTCYLHGSSTNTATTKADSDYDHGKWYNITQSLAGPCFNSPCSGVYDSCVVLKSGLTKCIPATI